MTSKESVFHIETALEICESVTRILSPGFGPCGRQTLLRTNMGEILVTNCGAKILRALGSASSHPIGRLVVDCVSRVYESTGDGSKTFFLLLTALLRGVARHLASAGNGSYVADKGRVELARAFRRLRTELLPSFLSSSRCFTHDVRFCESDFRYSIETFNAIKSLVDTYISTRYVASTQRHLAKLLAEFFVVEKDAMSAEALLTEVQDAIDRFSEVTVEVIGEHPTTSRVVDGIVIERDFLHEDRSLSGATRFVLMSSRVDEGDSTVSSKAIYQVSNHESSRLAVTWKRDACRRLISRLSELTVGLVISDGRISGSTNDLCVDAGISTVQFVPTEVTERISAVCGISAFESVVDLEEEDNESPVVGSMQSCKSISLGQKRCVHITGLKQRRETQDFIHSRPRQLIVCGLTKSVCCSMTQDLHGALLVLRTWLQPNSSLSLVDEENEMQSQAEEVESVSVNRDIPCAIASDLSCDSDATSHRSPDSGRLNNQYALVSGGGTFELLLHRYLYSLSSRHRPLLRDEADVDVCRIVATALLHVPTVIQQNSHHVKPSQCAVLELARGSADSVLRGINGRTGDVMSEEEAGKVVESVAGKVEVVLSCLQLVEQLLRIDAVVPVRCGARVTAQHDD